MDTSIKYMWMCDCPEIQGKKSKDGHPEVGCWITRHLYISKTLDYWIMEKAPHVWLPRQDQIQKMMDSYPMAYLLRMLYTRFHPELEPDSWEQLWLAFYMHDKHEKKWNGKEWKKE